MRIQVEDRRQLEHLLPFGFSFLLPYLTFSQTVALCVAALLYALFVSHHFSTTRDSERSSRLTSGKVFYALSVLLLVLLYFPATGVIAAGWAALAVGDSASNFFGRRWGRARLPWNRDKSWAGVLAFIATATPVAYFGLFWHGAESGGEVLLIFVFVAMTAGAAFESLPAVVDDNLTVSLVSASVLALLLASRPLTLDTQHNWATAALVSGGLALAALLLRLIRPSGALAGFLVGALVFRSFGPAGFVVLLLFFVLGTATTMWGLAPKQERRIAEPHRGRRSAVNALANGALAALFSLAHLLTGPGQKWLAVGFLAALATAAFDTVATEMGQLYGTRPRHPWKWTRVSPGTEGAVSLEGTLCGLIAAVLAVVVGVSMGLGIIPTGILCGVGAVAGGLAESLISARPGRLPPMTPGSRGHWMNFFNTVVGSGIAMLSAFSIREWIS